VRLAVGSDSVYRRTLIESLVWRSGFSVSLQHASSRSLTVPPMMRTKQLVLRAEPVSAISGTHLSTAAETNVSRVSVVVLVSGTVACMVTIE
jgi:hypothetical protein